MVQQEVLSNRWLLDAQEKPLESYQPEALHEKYHILKLEVFMNTQWLQNACAKHIVNKLLKGWIALEMHFKLSHKMPIIHDLIQAYPSSKCTHV